MMCWRGNEYFHIFSQSSIGSFGKQLKALSFRNVSAKSRSRLAVAARWNGFTSRGQLKKLKRLEIWDLHLASTDFCRSGSWKTALDISTC
jgi:hypothetical protein